MDERFPKYIRFIADKLSFFAVPNWSLLIVGLAVLAFVAHMAMGIPLDRFTFDPHLVLQGEWSRLFAFPTQVTNPIWFFFYAMYVYYVVGALEAEWGAPPLTLFIVIGYVAAVAAAFLTGHPVSIWFYIITNVSLAFGTLFPDVEFLLFLILPVKAKWLAWLAAALLFLQFLSGDLRTKVMLLMVMSPYMLFFGPMLFQAARLKLKSANRKRNFDKDIWR